MKEGFVLNPQTGRIISKSTSKYRRLVKLGLIDEKNNSKVEKEVIKKVEKTPEPAEPAEPAVQSPKKEEYSEEKLQKLLISKSTDIIQDNLNSFVNTAKRTDQQLDSLVKKMLFEKLMSNKTNKKEKEKFKKEKKTKKTKFKLRKVESSSSESSDSE